MTRACGAKTVTATNNAGSARTATFTVTPDTTAPSGQSADLSGGPWYTTSVRPADARRAAATPAPASTSQPASSSASDATLTDGTCDTFGSWAPVTLVGGADTTVTTGNCYRYRYTISDNVGNTICTIGRLHHAKVDTTAPSAPSLTLTESSPLSHVSGSDPLLQPQGSNSDTFTVDAATGDAQSGIDNVAFPNVYGTDGGANTSSPYSHDYTWTATDTATGAKTVTATNGAGSTSSATFTVTPDTSAPTGQAVDLAAGPWYTSLSIALTVDWGADAGSGLDNTSRVVERSEATLANGACDTFGSWAPVTLVAGADTSVTSGNCYRYRIQVTDNVGNVSPYSTVIHHAKVDTTIPAFALTAPTAVTGSGNQYWNAGTSTLYFRPSGSGSFTLNATSSDNQSGVDHVAFPDVSATTGWTGSTGGNDSAAPYASPTDYTWTAGATQLGSTTVTAVNGSGALRRRLAHHHRRRLRADRAERRPHQRALVHEPVG